MYNKNKMASVPWYTDAYNRLSNEAFNPDSVFRRELLPKIPNELLNEDSVFRREYLPPIRRAVGWGKRGGVHHFGMSGSPQRKKKRGGFFHLIDNAVRKIPPITLPPNVAGFLDTVTGHKPIGRGRGGNMWNRFTNEFTNPQSHLRQGANRATQMAYEQAMDPNSFTRATALPAAITAAPYLLKAVGRGRRQARPGDGRAKRGEICRQVMLKYPGMTLMQASSYVKEHGLYKP